MLASSREPRSLEQVVRLPLLEPRAQALLGVVADVLER
jgi:hypothetical protein